MFSALLLPQPGEGAGPSRRNTRGCLHPGPLESGDTCTPGVRDEGTPAPPASGIRGRLHPRPLGSGDTCISGVRDQGTPASQVSGIRGHLHTGCQGSGETCTLSLWDQGTPAPQASGIRTCPPWMTGPQALWVGTPSPQTRCSCGHCTEVSPRLLAWVLGNPRKSEEVTEATLRLLSLIHNSLNDRNVTEVRMGTTLSKWMSGKLDIL